MKREGVVKALLLGMMLSGCVAPEGGNVKKSDAGTTGGGVLQAELAQAKASLKQAEQAGGAWRDTGELIQEAEAAIGSGEVAKARGLLAAAQEEAQLGYAQAQEQKEAVKDLGGGMDEKPASAQVIAQGKQVAFDRKKGNCLSCHAMDDGVSPGTIGPPLVSIQQRFPNKSALYGQIWDATVRNPRTLMPPFGRHKILSKAELEQIVEYVWTL